MRGAPGPARHNKRMGQLQPAHDDALRQELLQSLKVLKDSAERVHDALNEAAGTYSVVRKLVEDGHRISELSDMIDPIPLRTALSDGVNGLERARHNSQRILFQILRAEGRTNAEIARKWGISRQLVSRLVNEQ